MSVSLIQKAIQAKLSSSGLDWVKLESFTLSSRDKKVNLELSLAGEETPVKAKSKPTKKPAQKEPNSHEQNGCDKANPYPLA